MAVRSLDFGGTLPESISDQGTEGEVKDRTVLEYGRRRIAGRHLLRDHILGRPDINHAKESEGGQRQPNAAGRFVGIQAGGGKY